MNNAVGIKQQATILQEIGELSSSNCDVIKFLNRKIKDKIIELDGEKPEKNEEYKPDIVCGYVNQTLDCQRIIKNDLAETERLLQELFRLV